VPQWRLFFMALGQWLANDAAAGTTTARRISGDDYPLGLTARLILAMRDGDNRARAELDRRLREIAPAFHADPVAGLIRRGFAPEIARRYGELLAPALIRRPEG
jgi:hypothetical protein